MRERLKRYDTVRFCLNISTFLLVLVASGCGGGSDGVVADRGMAEHLRDPIAHGERLFRQHCTQCHQRDGKGTAGAFPPLGGSARLTGLEPTPIAIVLLGLQGPLEVGDTFYNGIMPGLHHTLSDPEIASILTFARQAWGNQASGVDPAAVTAMRSYIGGRTSMLVASDLTQLPENVPGLTNPGE